MSRMKMLAVALAGGLTLSTAVPAPAQVSAQSAPGVNFSAYKTYNWENATPLPAGVNPIMVQQIIADFDAAMASKGYQKAGNGQLTLVLSLGAREKTDVQSWGRFGLQTSVYQYTQGQLSLDVFDSTTRRALWHGQVRKTINPDKPNPSKVNKAINQLMQKFPATAATAAPVSNPGGGTTTQ